MIIYGASGHAKVILDIIHSNRETDKIELIYDDNPNIKNILDYPVINEWSSSMDSQDVLVAIGNNEIREKITKRLENFSAPQVHSSSVISESSSIDKGSVVMANVIINASAKIGKHCIINSGAIIEHDVVVKDFVHISPGAVITGNVTIGHGSHIGAGATIIPGIKIGERVTIGAGAVVIEDIPDFAVVVGNPAKVIKYNKLEDE